MTMVVRIIFLLGILLTPAAGSGQDDDRRLTTLRRLYRQFDFEEAPQTTIPMPASFHRVLQGDADVDPDVARTLLDLGRMGFDDSIAYRGEWSFRFDPSGSSMVARVPTAVMPVIPFSDYVLAVQTRTEALEHARTRLVAWLADDSGTPIPGSRVASDLVRSERRWTELQVEVRGDDGNASDLVVQLEVLQPRAYLDDDEYPERPRLADVGGHAWFDDLVIWRQPRIDLAMDERGAVVTSPSTPGLSITVRDVAGASLTARLRIYDVAGDLIVDRRFPAPYRQRAREITTGISTYGWYRAILDIEDGSTVIGRRSIDFVHLSPDARRVLDDSFGVVMPDMNEAQLREVPAMLRRLDIGRATLPVWSSSLEIDPTEGLAELREVIEEVLRDGTRLGFALNAVPPALARTAELESGDVIDVMRRDPAEWRPYLDELLVNFGLDVSRWQLGHTSSLDAATQRDLAAAINTAATSLGELVPSPTIALPWPADVEPPRSGLDAALTIEIPYHIRPAAIGDVVTATPSDAAAPLFVLEPLPADRFAPRQRVIDVVLRALHAWRAGARQLAIHAPWHWSDDASSLLPDPILPAWRQLAVLLHRREIVGQLDVDGGECWILQGSERQDAALVAWGEDGAQLDMLLSNGPVRVIDIFGNEHGVDVDAGRHPVDLGPMPVFVESIDVALARFRGEMSIEPDVVTSLQRVSEHDLILRNPWDRAISGHVRLVDTGKLQMSPRRMDFSIDARGETRLPISIVFDRNALAGTQPIDTEIVLNADDQFVIRTSTALSVGWPEVLHRAYWRTVENPRSGDLDLVVSQSITNRGERVIRRLDLYLKASGIPHDRRPIAGLRPGDTVTRSFRIPSGGTLLAGKPVRVGAIEVNGVSRLNRELMIGDAPITAASASGR